MYLVHVWIRDEVVKIMMGCHNFNKNYTLEFL